jgi:K+/H+ antiporter YhaU regulatory subunit KhtT
MRGNGSSPHIDTDDDEDEVYTARETSRRIRALQRHTQEVAETQGAILAGLSDLKKAVSTRRSKTWSAKEWATLLAAVAAAVTATGGVLAHFLGK